MSQIDQAFKLAVIRLVSKAIPNSDYLEIDNSVIPSEESTLYFHPEGSERINMFKDDRFIHLQICDHQYIQQYLDVSFNDFFSEGSGISIILDPEDMNNAEITLFIKDIPLYSEKAIEIEKETCINFSISGLFLRLTNLRDEALKK